MVHKSMCYWPIICGKLAVFTFLIPMGNIGQHILPIALLLNQLAGALKLLRPYLFGAATSKSLSSKHQVALIDNTLHLHQDGISSYGKLIPLLLICSIAGVE